jgi:diguanylate cyclase (GGDEF)-like protein
VELQSSAANAIVNGRADEQRLARALLSEEGWRLAESVSALTQAIALNFSRAAGQLQLQAQSRLKALRWRIAIAVTVALGLMALAGWLSNRAWRATALNIQRLEKQSTTDALTNLPNQRAFKRYLFAEIARTRRENTNLMLAYLDLDHFKLFNDAHGYPAGDALLRDAAQQWLAVIRPSDVLARIGGEEFALIMPRCTDADAHTMVERLRAATPKAQTVSAGITQLAPDDTAETLIARADAMLYQAKRSGRDRSVGRDSLVVNSN